MTAFPNTPAEVLFYADMALNAAEREFKIASDANKASAAERVGYAAVERRAAALAYSAFIEAEVVKMQTPIVDYVRARVVIGADNIARPVREFPTTATVDDDGLRDSEARAEQWIRDDRDRRGVAY